eukprot:2278823-Rhodomonas_salina.2
MLLWDVLCSVAQASFQLRNGATLLLLRSSRQVGQPHAAACPSYLRKCDTRTWGGRNAVVPAASAIAAQHAAWYVPRSGCWVPVLLYGIEGRVYGWALVCSGSAFIGVECGSRVQGPGSRVQRVQGTEGPGSGFKVQKSRNEQHEAAGGAGVLSLETRVLAAGSQCAVSDLRVCTADTRVCAQSGSQSPARGETATARTPKPRIAGPYRHTERAEPPRKSRP